MARQRGISHINRMAQDLVQELAVHGRTPEAVIKAGQLEVAIRFYDIGQRDAYDDIMGPFERRAESVREHRT